MVPAVGGIALRSTMFAGIYIPMSIALRIYTYLSLSLYVALCSLVIHTQSMYCIYIPISIYSIYIPVGGIALRSTLLARQCAQYIYTRTRKYKY